MKRFRDLTEAEILALAISQEEEDGRLFADFAAGLRQAYPGSAAVFDEMQQEESEHRGRLIDLYRQRFGDHIPLIRRQDVRGFDMRRSVWLSKPRTLAAMRRHAAVMELEARNFYERAAQQVRDASTRKLLGDLAALESQHVVRADSLEKNLPVAVVEAEDAAARRLFVLQVIQPGLAGLMDGSVSTLAPLFAAAFATRSSHDALLVGLAASVGAGISMGFAEALSDDGSLTGRGHPWIRGLVCGLMTTAGGLGHTLPYLIPQFTYATAVAIVVVIIELGVISYIRHKYMDTPFLSATMQVVIGGVLVFLTGWLIGSA